MRAVSPSVIRQRLVARTRIRHLQVLVDIADLGSLSRAADARGMTQPAVTQILAELERLLEAPLFFRHARGMRPTRFAQSLLPVVRRILGAIDVAAEQAAALTAQAQGQVRVAAIGGAITGILVQTIPAFSNAYPEVLVQLLEAEPVQIANLIADKEIDLALCRCPAVIPDGWEFIDLLKDEFVVVAGPQHPLATPGSVRQGSVSMNELGQQEWMALPPNSLAASAFDQWFAGFEPQVKLRWVSARMPEMLWAMLVNEPLLALVPASLVRQLIGFGQLVLIPLPEPMPLPALGMLRPHEGRGAAANRLANFLMETVGVDVG